MNGAIYTLDLLNPKNRSKLHSRNFANPPNRWQKFYKKQPKIQFMKKILFFLSFYLLIQNYNSQIYNCDINSTNKSSQYSFIQSYYEKDSEIEIIIKKITTNVGLQPNFISLNYPNYDNCSALNLNGFRYIVYDKDFLNNLANNGNRTVIITSVISHEIAHHLQGHTINNTNIKNRKYDELESDKFAGYISAKLGYSLNDALAFINSLKTINNSPTHPNKSDRLIAVQSGYEFGNSEINNTIAREKLSIENTILAKSDEYFIEGESFRQEKKYDKAINSFFKSLALREDALPKILISQCYLEQKDFKNAIKILTDLEQSNNVNEKLIKDLLYYNLGYSFYNLQDYNKSIYYYKKVVSLDDNDIISKAKLASAYYYNNEIDKAYSIFTNPSFDSKVHASGLQDFSIGDIYLEKGLVYAEKKQYKSAITYYEKSEKLFWQGHPSKIISNYYIANSYNETQDERQFKYYDTFIDEYINSNIEIKEILKSQFFDANFKMSYILRDNFAKTYKNGKIPEWKLIKKSSDYLINILSIDFNNTEALIGVGVNFMADPTPDRAETACEMFKKACDLGESKGCELFQSTSSCKK